jgi:EpsI family protein
MIINRLLIVQIILALGMGVVFLVPQKSGTGPAGIALALPKDLGMWTGSEATVSEAELKGLAPDTRFARRLYTDPFGDQIYVSIVLSGADMVTSIHRPERCLPAQGWTVERSNIVQVPMANGAPPLAVTELSNIQSARLKDKAGSPVTVRQLDYYWFIGSRDVTPSTLERTYIDIKDRILHGENQRWAYVTVAATVTDNLERFGHNEAETSKMVQDFIAEIVPKFQRPPANG